jgi:hypothetical protein
MKCENGNKNESTKSLVHYLESANRCEGRTFEWEAQQALYVAQDPTTTQKEKLDALMGHLRQLILTS